MVKDYKSIGRITIVTNTKIEIKDLYKIFGPNPAVMLNKVKAGISKEELLEKYNHTVGLQDINIGIPACGIQVVMGLSGAGKSTLIRHINRLIEPTSGKIIVDGEDVLAMQQKELTNFRRFKASMVFQKFSLFPHRTVTENVAYGLKIQSKSKDEITNISSEWIERVGLGGFENHYPAQLSGGMQQRVGLIRALATNPDILLMDEAFSALDPLIRSDMQNILLELQKELNKTIVFITHDLDEALKLGDNIVILRGGEMVQQGNPQEIILKPIDDYVTDFTKDINRGKIIQVKHIIEKEPASSDFVIDANTTVEEAIEKLVNADISSASVKEKSSIIGSITTKNLVSVISRR
ncbi:MAG: Glycine betaine/carnitine transport ATP-binding protein GbuA [Alphaproteobacteria bacterium MarineAlpha2_Bin1]|nr:MAG: Glycine betaine/carnitine transport ATP-binding protein GbuA [Alphaproteobacteria bacterium MarineAlpha2_Bin1]